MICLLCPITFAGIIPAYAGSTSPQSQPRQRRQGSSPHTRGAPRSTARFTRPSGDHPRIRGEHDGCGGQGDRRRGIIPAYAGSTAPALGVLPSLPGSSPHTRGTRAPRRTTATTTGDHPRIRGEHSELRSGQGSGGGIIPAYAGNTASAKSAGTFSAGSSPHTRGTLSSMLMPN